MHKLCSLLFLVPLLSPCERSVAQRAFLPPSTSTLPTALCRWWMIRLDTSSHTMGCWTLLLTALVISCLENLSWGWSENSQTVVQKVWTGDLTSLTIHRGLKVVCIRLSEFPTCHCLIGSSLLVILWSMVDYFPWTISDGVRGGVENSHQALRVLLLL